MKKEVVTLISLLEDNDSEVINSVTNQLLKYGVKVIKDLEVAWEKETNRVVQERLEKLIHIIQFNNTRQKLVDWIRGGAEDLLEGAVCIAQFQYPNASLKGIKKLIKKISSDIYLSAENHLTAVEKVRLLNYVIYDLNNFTRNNSNFYSPQNSFINQVIETRKGNPISLGIIYLAIAQKIGLPIYGVNLPKSFILAYMNNYKYADSEDRSVDVLFYINPYNKGTILNRKEIEYFIEQQNLEKKEGYFTPCDNISIIVRLISNLIIAYQKLDFNNQVIFLQDLLIELEKQKQE